MSTWVQHISGQGAKWKVADAIGKITEVVVLCGNGTGFHYLPKSEYKECSPPEEWVDVTGECTYSPPNSPSDVGTITHPMVCIPVGMKDGNVMHGFHSSYRIRKIDGLHHGPAFIVEKRVP